MLASETRKLAREALAGKWGKAALLTLVYMLIVYVISFVLSFIPAVGQIAQVVIDIPIAFGLISTFIKLKRGEDVSYTGFLTDGFNNFANSWKVTLWVIVKMLIPVAVFVVAIVVLLIGSGVTIAGAAASSYSATNAGGSVLIIGFIAMIAASIWLTIKSYSYQLVYYILFDNPTKDAKEIVEESEKLMNGNRWRLFCLELSFIGWSILTCFTLGIGMLWLMPYMVIAQIVFYEVLVGKKSDTVEATVEETTVEPVQDTPAVETTVEPVQEAPVEETPAEPVQEEDNGPISGE